MDLDSVGLRTLPPAMIQHLRSCETDFFLIPAASSPFNTTNVYRTGRVVYDPDYTQAFSTSYAKVGSTKHYDVYACAHAP
jgi:hypothetical protein